MNNPVIPLSKNTDSSRTEICMRCHCVHSDGAQASSKQVGQQRLRATAEAAVNYPRTATSILRGTTCSLAVHRVVQATRSIAQHYLTSPRMLNIMPCAQSTMHVIEVAGNGCKLASLCCFLQ